MSWGEEPTPGVGREPDAGRGQDPPDAGQAYGQGWGQDPPRNQLRPLSLSDVLDGMFRLTRDHWRAFTLALGALWGIILIVYILGFGLVGLGGFLTLGTLAGGDAPPGPGALTALVAGFGVFALVLFLALIVIMPLSYSVPIHIAATGYRGSTVTARDGLRAGLRRYWRVLGTLLLQALIIIAIAGVLALPLIALGSLAGDSAGVIAVIVLLAIAAVVVVIAASTRVALSVPAVMTEGLGPGEAIRRSNALVKGKTATVFGRLLVAGLIVAVIVFAVTFGAAMLAGLLGGTSDNAATAIIAAIVYFVVQLVGGMLQQALMACALVLVYFDRRVRTEGLDLTEDVNELGAGTQPSS